MKPLSRDTSPEAHRVLVRLWRETPPWRKLEIMCELNAAVKLLAREGLVLRFPDASPQEIDRRLADLMLGPQLAARVYGLPPYETRPR